MSTQKRLFFGFHVVAPWPERLPEGRIIPEESRHFTIAFLGNQNSEVILEKIEELPRFFSVGKAGFFEKCLFLPERKPNVVAWEGKLFEDSNCLQNSFQEMQNWLKNCSLPTEERKSWLCHATMARQPFDQAKWQKAFQHLPFMITHLHLYESLPSSHYIPLWSHSYHLPFDEIEHTADIAFIIRGETLESLFYHSFLALSWRFPELIPFLPKELIVENLDDIVIALNQITGTADSEIGCPYKAISFHGEIEKKNEYLEWEMIVDV